MRCPFLREAQVKFCRASAYRKMITREPGQEGAERCSSADYVNCPSAKQRYEDRPSANHCPFLQESLMQYCAASPVTRYIPYSASTISPCGTSSHRYCELFCALADPEGVNMDEVDPPDATIDGLAVPGRMSYSPNHLWCDLSEDSVFHVGIDAFAARVFGGAERLSFITQKGLHYPTALLTIHGVDLQFIFPRQVMVTRTNSYLRTNPGKLFSHPYTLGWLFEGTMPYVPGVHRDSPQLDGMTRGNEARKWMKDECRRMNDLAHEFQSRPDGAGRVAMADGGTFAPGILQELSRDDVHRVFNEFFSPFLNRRPVP